jgi:hypothetical protein
MHTLLQLELARARQAQLLALHRNERDDPSRRLGTGRARGMPTSARPTLAHDHLAGRDTAATPRAAVMAADRSLPGS